MTVGYTYCACRDCMEIAIAGDDDKPDNTLCGECEDAGCEGDAECQAPGAYGGVEPEPPVCLTCCGPAGSMGVLGNREHFRCRDCGAEFSIALPPKGPS